ncbi:MAG TPA: hypothetical protein VHB21_01340 [Minicystis sp.]|nr:hypothetical protein [Minicystis sp.]
MPASALQTLARFEGVEHSTADDVWAIWQFGAYTADAVIDAEAVAMASLTRMLLVIEPSAPAPGSEVRNRIVALWRKKPIRALAVVSPDAGFRAALISSVLVGMKLVSGIRLQLRSFTALDDAGQWLGSFAREGDDGVALSAALGEYFSPRRAARRD